MTGFLLLAAWMETSTSANSTSIIFAQVEVVEGPMSVVYGNNALAGTINLITKQNAYHTLEAQAKAFAESVGRYSGNLSLSQKAGKNNFTAEGGYEYFFGS